MALIDLFSGSDCSVSGIFVQPKHQNVLISLVISRIMRKYYGRICGCVVPVFIYRFAVHMYIPPQISGHAISLAY